MNLPGYDAWKLATPPEYEIAEEEERAMELAWQDREDALRAAVEDAITDAREGDAQLSRDNIRHIVLQELAKAGC